MAQGIVQLQRISSQENPSDALTMMVREQTLLECLRSVMGIRATWLKQPMDVTMLTAELAERCRQLDGHPAQGWKIQVGSKN